MMNKLKNKKSQILMLVILATLLFVSPLISTSLRPKYLYFIFNLLIIALAAEAGLFLPADSLPSHNSSSAVSPASKPTTAPDATSTTTSTTTVMVAAADHEDARDGGAAVSDKVVEKCPSSEKTMDGNSSLKNCPSMPSLFFIADQADHCTVQESMIEDDDTDELMMSEDDVGEMVSGQELFTKAETFIGNFYKQLKMQSQDR